VSNIVRYVYSLTLIQLGTGTTDVDIILYTSEGAGYNTRARPII